MPQGERCRFCLRRDQQQLLNQVEAKNVCGAPPQTALVTRGRGVRKPIDRLLWPLALGAWTYATGSPTPEGLGSIPCAQKAPIHLSGFRHPRTVRTRSSSIIGHTPADGKRSIIPASSATALEICFQRLKPPLFVGRSYAPRLPPSETTSRSPQTMRNGLILSPSGPAHRSCARRCGLLPAHEAAG